VCGHQRVKELMGFRQDWNRKIIAQFYATAHFGYIEEERAMTWMTNGNKHAIRFSQFLTLFGLGLMIRIIPSCIMVVCLSQRLCTSCILGITG
jgi:hypothetical protein